MKINEILEMHNPMQFIGELNVLAPILYEKIMTEYQQDKSIDLEELKNFILCLERAYTDSISPIRDEDYDTLMSIYEELSGGKIIRGDMLTITKIKHMFPDLKGTIRKCHYMTELERLQDPNGISTHKSIEHWVRDCMKDLSKEHIINVALSAYPKFDGVSIILGIRDGKCVSAITRGDKELGMGENKLHIFKGLEFPELEAAYGNLIGLKCEAIMKKQVFPEYNAKYGNNALVDERAAVNSILNSDEPTMEQIKYLTLVPLMLEVDHKMIPLPIISGNDTYSTVVRFLLSENNLLDSIKNLVLMITAFIKSSEFKCDGIVFRLEGPRVFELLGRNNEECVNNFERAYKFRPEGHKTILTDIVQDIGLMGKVSFTAKVEPVIIDNKTITSVSLGSYMRMELLKLRKGDEVLIKYDIIPYLIKDKTCKESKNAVIEVITECPYCHEKLVLNPELSCANNECPSRIIGKIYNYCEKLNMYNIGEATIETLYHHGLLNNILDLYTLQDKKDEFIAIEGFGKKTFKAMIKEIDTHKRMPAEQFLGALGIPGISRKTFTKILEKVPYEKIISDKKVCLTADDLTDIPGIKTKTIMKIINGLDLNKDLISKLLDYVSITVTQTVDMRIHVCFSLVRNKAFEKHLNDTGVIVDDSVTKHTNILIASTGSSGKIDKATKLGIPIITLEEAYRRFNYDQ